ncbi:MAG: tRNA-dihydrouridine synthase family protein [Pseudobutyrivibrio sp.]|nr:tRNA-dihydrouridine synthase family protein [Pseudobutyrivibrio sp.]
MKQKIYFAPLEGVTDSIFRNTFEKYYGGIDKYFTPFLSPNSTYKFTTREFNQIDPEKNNIENTVPQLLTNDAEHFLWAASEIASLGYKEINFNLGCPSGTVVAKKKGSGLLFYPEMLDNMLYQVFNGLESACNKKGCNTPDISIKTRLGKLEADEFYEILDIYNKYPISELTIHPRIQKDFYREPLKPEFFDYAITHSRAPLVFNGDIVSILDIDNTFSIYPDINAIMIGRGLLANPGLVLAYKKGLEEYPLDLKTFKSFHDDLLIQYTELLSGEKPVLHRMKEFIAYWERNFPDDTKIIKKIRKSNSINEYKSNIYALFN